MPALARDDTKYSTINDANPIFEDDLILPEQYFAPKGWRVAEQELASAQLMDAIEILTGKRAAKRYQWDRDREWLMSEAQEPMDFLWICRVLDLNHYAVRECTLKNLIEPMKHKPRGTHKLSRAARKRAVALINAGRVKQLADCESRAEMRNIQAHNAMRRKNAVH